MREGGREGGREEREGGSSLSLRTDETCHTGEDVTFNLSISSEIKQENKTFSPCG